MSSRILYIVGLCCILASFTSATAATAHSASNPAQIESPAWELSFTGPANYVFSHLAVYNNKLYVSGTTYGSQNNGRIYVYDGVSWADLNFSPVGAILDAAGPMEVFSGRLYIGTRVNVSGSAYARVYYYDGTTFTQDLSVPAVFGCTGIEDLAIHENTLYAALGACGQGNVYRRNGDANWTTLGGVPGGDAVRAIASYLGGLYIGTGTGGTQAKVWRWNGSAWELAINITTYFSTGQDGVWSLASANGLLYAGVAGPANPGPIPQYNGTTWSSDRTVPTGVRFAVIENQLWVGARNSVLVNDGSTWQDYGSPNGDYPYDFAFYKEKVWAATGNTGHIYYIPKTSVKLSVAPPTEARVGDLVYVPVYLGNVDTSHDIRGVQFGVRVSDYSRLAPAGDQQPHMGDLFSTDSLTHTVPITNGWDFMLTAPFSPTSAISGTGIIVELPFYAEAEGCIDLAFADHILTNSSAVTISHQTAMGQICLVDQGHLVGTTYLQGHASDHYSDTLIQLEGPRGVYTTTTDVAGNFSITNMNSGVYTATFTHPLFVNAIRKGITITGQMTTTLPEVGLWAGDMNLDGEVDNPDWYICAAASIPVNDPAFDINGDNVTNIIDCTLVGSNIGRPNMKTTNPPRSRLMALAQGINSLTADYGIGNIVIVSSGDGDLLLRAIDITGQLYAAGARLSLPVGATVTRVELRDGFAGGFLRWHQDSDNLYIIATPNNSTALTRDTDIALLHIMGGEEVILEAASPVGEKITHLVFLPLVIRR